MQQVVISGQVFKLPENWQEVEYKHLTELLRNLYVLPESGSTYHTILRIVLGYDQKQWKKLMQHFFAKDRSQEDMEQSLESLRKILSMISWMWTSDLTVAPVESIIIDGQKYVLFQPGFISMSFGELADAYIHAQAFVKQLVEGEERMNMLVSTVLRPERSGDYKSDPNWNGDPREDYNEHIARERAGLFTGKYVDMKIMIMVYFLGSVKNFFSYFDLFDNDGSAPPAPEEFPGQSMIKNQHLLSEKHIFGGMKATKQANVHDVFTFLEEHNKDVKAQIARSKANQTD